MKFDIGVRVEGKSGEFQGIEGVISERLKVGSQTQLLISWSNRRFSRVPAGAIRVLQAGGPNEVAALVYEVIPDPQVEDEDQQGYQDDMSQWSQSSEEGSVEDLGDQDG